MKRLPVSTAVVVLGMCMLWIGLGSRILPGAKSHDFLSFYTGAALALDGRFSDLYDPNVQLAREKQIVPHLTTLVPFIRPGFYAAFLAPLALLPFDTAFAAWIVGQSLLLILCWIWAWRRFGPDALIFAALSLSAPLGIASGQDCVLLLALFVAAYELAERKRPLASGMVLALLLLKFHLVLLWPVALLIQRRWRMLAGFCAMAVAEVTLCVALGGVQVIRSYADLLRNKSLELLSPSPQLMIGYQGLVANLGIHSPAVILGIVAAVIMTFLWAVRHAPLWRTFALTAVASLYVAPHVYGYDATLLLLPLLLTIFLMRPVSRVAAVLMSTPLPFGFALADKPWAVVSSASLLLLFAILAVETFRTAVPADIPVSLPSAPRPDLADSFMGVPAEEVRG